MRMNRRRAMTLLAIMLVSVACFAFAHSEAVYSHESLIASQKGGSAVARAFDVRVFGAKGDGKTVDSPAINKAIDAAASAGGGTVVFPAGTYRSYSIRLKSNVALYLDQGSNVLATDPKDGDGKIDTPKQTSLDTVMAFVP